MDEYSIVRFFNQFIAKIKRDDVRRFGIITDKDGTILLNAELRDILKSLKNKNMGQKIYIIANSGRTVSDMVNSLEQENIPLEYFDYIIGDNGGMCVDVNKTEELYKNTMDKSVVLKVIEYFLEHGGQISDIRLANGENIFVYPDEDVKNYYYGNQRVVFTENICDLNDIDITKLTITGSHSQIQELDRFIRENIPNYKTHIGQTAFPTRERKNYRIDFTRNAYKR